MILTVMQTTQKPVERVSQITGTVRVHKDFESKILANKRNLSVYLPPSYDNHLSQRFPVLYMADGQNLFDGKTSYIPNQTWRADAAAESGPV